MWFLGTNDNPGDYRNSGCAGCHVVYANDRDPQEGGPYAAFGNRGTGSALDPTIRKGETGHPIVHRMTTAIPTSQCMICHMHQPNLFLNSMLGYTMWDYETGAPQMWPKKQRYPTDEEMRAALERNPEAAVVRGKWADPNFSADVNELNPKLTDTQFADYHGHGWNFRAIFKRDRKGNLLDDANNVIPQRPAEVQEGGASRLDPCRFRHAMRRLPFLAGQSRHRAHLRRGAGGDRDHLRRLPRHRDPIPRPADARSRGAADRHRSVDPAHRRRPRPVRMARRQALPALGGLSRPRMGDDARQGHGHARQPQIQSARGAGQADVEGDLDEMGPRRVGSELAHSSDEMACYTCHLSWTTSCAGCHLPIEANQHTARHHFEGETTRNYATYNPEVAREDMFQLGRHSTVKNNIIAPIASRSALVLSSTNINREHIYVQQPPVSSAGFSSQAFSPHYPHTERRTETKTCTDCHISAQNDNNAIMAQLLLLGTNFVNFVGYNAWVGEASDIEAVRVTEWDEPQAVIGSYLHRYAYPDFYAQHLANNRELPEAHGHSSNNAQCIQLRGEYLYVAEGDKGMRVYDVASVANKGFSERIITAPFSPLGQDTHIASTNATCVVLPTNQPINPPRNAGYNEALNFSENYGPVMRGANEEQVMHPIYNYAFVTDSVEGLIVVNVNTLQDQEPRNNFFSRALTWNDNGILNGARNIAIAGTRFYVMADAGIVELDMNDPLHPRLVAVIPIRDARSAVVQFRYLFVADGAGLDVVDVTNPDHPALVPSAHVPLADAHHVFVARTYAYVADGRDGLAIIDVERPTAPRVKMMYTADGKLNDARDVVIGATNASDYAYVADGANGLKVIQLMSPESQPNFYGFSPEPKPELIAWSPTTSPALSLSRGLERDRAVDETGHQIAVFGRIGSRPFTLPEMQELYMGPDGRPYTVTDTVQQQDFVPARH
jgi:hypothetical protein